MYIQEVAFKNVLRAHGILYERSGGLIGHKLLGVPTLMLRTTGRRSGQTRTNSLVYAPDGENWLVVGSKGGSDQPPAWLLNLKAEPAVEVQVGRKRIPAMATVFERGDADFDRLWKLVNEGNASRYEAYQGRTARQIPVVVLSPRTPQ